MSNKNNIKLIQKLLSSLLMVIIFLGNSNLLYSQDEEKELKIPPQFRGIRIYGGDDETLPPVVILQKEGSKVISAFGSNSVTIEFDVEASVPPSLYAKFVHCDINWKETENVFINEVAYQRTSNISWEIAPMFAGYYTHRGKLKVPNSLVKFNYPGNWKVKLFDFDNDTIPFAEGKFFVVQPRAECRIDIYSEFYTPELKITTSAVSLEAVVWTSETIFDNLMNTVVIYRNNRWNEPYVISNNPDADIHEKLYKYKFKRLIGGFASVEKRFRIERIPAENGYRLLDMTNLAVFPRTTAPVRIPLSDLRRNGSYMDYDDDGAMITRNINSSMDDYVNVEFVMDPQDWVSKEDVFVIGSFNNWMPDPTWQMFYDKDLRLYRLFHWVRRARHGYLYATGRINSDTRQIEHLSCDEYEGNTVSTSHTYVGFVYYRETEFGGYDALIGVGAGSIYGNIRR